MSYTDARSLLLQFARETADLPRGPMFSEVFRPMLMPQGGPVFRDCSAWQIPAKQRLEAHFSMLSA